MKNIFFKMAMLATAVFISSIINAQTTPSSVGAQVYGALLSGNSYESFSSWFLSADECRKVAQQSTSSVAHNELNDLADALEQGQVVQNRVYRIWSSVNALGRQFGIDWEKIEYIDWFYNSKTKMGVSGLVGTLVFKYNNKYFMVSPTIYKVNNQYYKLAHWGNSFEKIMQAVLSGNVQTVYQNGQYCLFEGSQSDCINIAQKLNEMDF